MSRVRSDFLKWQPDMDDFDNPGLTVATNLLHDTEGYKQLLKQTAGAFTTTPAISGGTVTVLSFQVKPAGVGANRLYCMISPLATTAPMVNFSIGDHDTDDEFTNVSATTLASASAAAIKSFSTADTPNGILITAQMTASLVASTTTISLSVLAIPT